jgi:hypothetical protein
LDSRRAIQSFLPISHPSAISIRTQWIGAGSKPTNNTPSPISIFDPIVPLRGLLSISQHHRYQYLDSTSRRQLLTHRPPPSVSGLNGLLFVASSISYSIAISIRFNGFVPFVACPSVTYRHQYLDSLIGAI